MGLCATPQNRLKGAPGQVPSLSEGVGKDKECSERRGKGRARMPGAQGPLLSAGSVPLHFVLVEMKTNCSHWQDQRAVNSLGCSPTCAGSFVRKGPLSGDRGPEKALVVQGQCGEDTIAAAG